jgi:FtsH-binding integral membrane protein
MFGASYNPSGINYRSVSEINTAMAGVYKNMGLAVLTSMIISYLVSNSPALMALLFGTALKWIVMFAPLVAVLALSFSLHKVSKSTAQLLLHGFAALMGLSMAAIFAVYTSVSIFTAFMGAAVLFGVMSVYGYFTKRDLTSIGQFLFVGLIAIIIASVINIFVGSTVTQMVISAIAVIVFLGLTAYDTQNIRQQLSITDSQGNAEVVGALSLYLNFINLFMSLLQLFGNKNE